MNIISKLYALKYSALIAREKFRESVWRNAFQTAERAINTSENEKKIASAQNFLAKHWRKIHAAGIDLAEIVQVMNPMDVIEQFDTLQNAGAHLDINQIASSVTGIIDSEDLHRLHSLNADMNKLVRRGRLEIQSLDQINDLIINGVSAQTMFELSRDYMISYVGDPDGLCKILHFFHSHGITEEQISKFMHEIIPVKFIEESKLPIVANLIDDIVNDDGRNVWFDIGIDCLDYVKPWIVLNCDDYLGIDDDDTLSKLPEAVSVKDFIHCIDIQYIVYEFDRRGMNFHQFIRYNFLPAKGDIEDLAKSALRSKLQYDNPVDWLTLAAISSYGSRLIDRKKLLEFGDTSKYTSEEYYLTKDFIEQFSMEQES